ncbi:MAG: hypothetical protein NT168_10475 [Planctomycetota bacterium]|nr:hypothetical protein [Planctomycetota bacterium]
MHGTDPGLARAISGLARAMPGLARAIGCGSGAGSVSKSIGWENAAFFDFLTMGSF